MCPMRGGVTRVTGPGGTVVQTFGECPHWADPLPPVPTCQRHMVTCHDHYCRRRFHHHTHDDAPQTSIPQSPLLSKPALRGKHTGDQILVRRESMLVRRDRPMIARLQVARIRVLLYIGGGWQRSQFGNVRHSGHSGWRMQASSTDPISAQWHPVTVSMTHPCAQLVPA